MAKMTPEESNQQAMDFEAAFKEEQAGKQEPTEAEAFPGAEAPPEPAMAESTQQGMPEAGEVEPGVSNLAEGSAPAASPEAQADQASSASAGGADGEPPAVAVAIETGAADGTDVAPDGQDEPIDPKDEQRAKSWEGRLKKREEELAAREAALKERETPAAQAAEVASGGEGAEPVAEAVAEAVDQVESGKMTPDQAIKTLTEDFGPEFANLLSVLIESKATEIAGRAADERVGSVSKTIDALVGEIVQDKQRSHFESISDAHPDFVEVAEGQDFKDWVQAMPEEERAKALETIDNGSSRAIVKLISTFKAGQEAGAVDEPTAPPADAVPEADADNAEGVRSGGLRLPEAPARADGYEEAWDKF